MANATAFPVNEGWQYLTNTSQFNLVKASVVGWQYSSHGIAAFMAFSFIIILAGTFIYIKTQKIYPSAFAMIFLTYVIDYYAILDIPVYEKYGLQIIHMLYIAILLLIAGATFFHWWNRQ